MDLTLTSHERSHKEVKEESTMEISLHVSSKTARKEKSGMESQFSIREKINSVKKNHIIVEQAPFEFHNPCPKTMQHLSIKELSSNDISWKMMTSFRPE